MNSQDPWTLYWQADHLASCVEARDSDAASLVAGFWRNFANGLAEHSSVIDLATGNGVVPLELRRTRQDLAITGADRASIDPSRHCADVPELAEVTFRGEIDLRAATELGRYDAVTSQFGVEYLGVAEAPGAIDRHLAARGRIALLLHDRSSVLLAQSAESIEEMQALRENGPLAALDEWSRGELTAAALEARTRGFLAAPLRRTRQLSGQIVQAVDLCLSRAEGGDGQGAAALAASVLSRFEAERARLLQLRDAALDADQLGSLIAALAERGIVCDPPYALEVSLDAGQRASIGWCVTGARCA